MHKTKFPIYYGVVFTLLFSLFSAAQEVYEEFDPFDPESTPYPRECWPAMIRIDYRSYDTTLSFADQLLKNSKSKEHSDFLLAQISKDSKSRLVEIATLSARHGETTIIDNTSEIMYVTSYRGTGPHTDEINQISAEDGTDGNETKNTAQSQAIAIPASFETRKTGLTLAMEPNLGHNKGLVDISIDLDEVRLARFEPIAKTEQGKVKFPFGMPVFYSQKINTSQTIRSGHSLLVGITIPLNEHKEPSTTHRRLHFVTVSIDRVPPKNEP